jgi:hypothetical protein
MKTLFPIPWITKKQLKTIQLRIEAKTPEKKFLKNIKQFLPIYAKSSKVML